MREMFMNNSKTTFEQGVVTAQAHARSLSKDAQLGYVSAQGDTTINQAIAARDDDTRAKLIDSHNQLIDGLADTGVISSSKAVEMKRSWAQQYATADVLARSKEDPEGVVNELRAKPGSPQSLDNRIVSVEGYGKNPRSSAQGAGGFIDSTWLDVLKRNRPDLAEGRSDADLLALRADKKLGLEMVGKYREENARSLKAAGFEATPGNVYLAHFLGAGGARAVLKADPNMPVQDALAKALGPAKAKEMVEANPEVLQGKLVGSVKAWADGKMGGATPGGGAIYDFLRPDVREQLLARADAELQKRIVQDISGFKQRIEDNQAEAAKTGNVSKPLQLSDFISNLGAADGPKAFEAYQANLQLGRDVSRVAALSPPEQQELLASYAPKPGEGFADQAKRQGILAKAVAQVRKELDPREGDPAQFAITRIPSAQEAWGNLSRAMTDAQASPVAKQQAARTFADITTLEQQKAGVAATDIRILPKGYVETLKGRLESPQEAGGTANVVKQLRAEAALWGDAWPRVYRQIAGEVGPLVRVIGSGVPDTPARILTELAPQKVGDILKDQSVEKANQIKKDVLEAFTPFLKSMAGNEGGLAVFNDFRGQAEKLSAYYIVGGMSSADASKKAFKELIGDRYEFRDSWRMPKGLAQAPDEIQRGTVQAMRDLEAIGIAPPADNVGGLSADYLVKAKADAIRRDGKWITAPDESGLALVYNDEAVRGSNGKPLILSWSQLGDIGQRAAARDKASRARFVENPLAFN